MKTSFGSDKGFSDGLKRVGGRLKTARGLLRVITDDFGCGRLLYRVTQNRFELFHGGAVQVVKINFPMVIAVAFQTFLIAETVQFGKRGGFVVKRALMQDAQRIFLRPSVQTVFRRKADSAF